MAAPTERPDLLRKRLERFTRLLPAVEQGDVEALHRMRVASRRLRELLPVLQLDHDTTRKLGRRLRKVTDRLGAVRELDVLLILIDELHESRRHEQQALALVAAGVTRERAAAREKLLDRKLPAAELKQIARKLGRALTGLEKLDAQPMQRRTRPRGWRWALDARIASRATSMRDALADAGAVYLPDRLHRVRIAVKKLRYALELSAEVDEVKSTPDLRTLKRAQELLGRLHDLQILVSRVRQVQAALLPPTIGVWRELDTLVTALENSCRRLHARFMRDRAALETIADTLAAQTKSGARAAHASSRADTRRAAV
jgi:CHAD domain-containing protein